MIKINNLSFQYPNQTAPALSDISIAVPKGSCFGLLGPNGAGKTTLISILNGLLGYQHGEVQIAGKQLNTQLAEIQAISALVPQEYAFYPRLSAQENLAFFGGILGLSGTKLDKRIDQVIETCQLSAVVKKRAQEYSGGLKRRLNLAIGLLGDPEILYLDEPTVGIDPQSRQFILESIGEVNAAGKTIIYTSHYMEEVEKLCDEVAIVDHGRVVTSGKLSDVLAVDKRCLTIKLANCPSEVALSSWQSHWRGKLQWDGKLNQLSIAGELSNAELSELHKALAEENCTVLAMNYGKGSLEELFMLLTKKALRD